MKELIDNIEQQLIYCREWLDGENKVRMNQAAFYDYLKSEQGLAKRLYELGSEFIIKLELSYGFPAPDGSLEKMEKFWEISIDGSNPTLKYELLKDINSTFILLKSTAKTLELQKIPENLLLSEFTGNVDQWIKEYFTEAIKCFNAGTLKACVIMMGTVSEKALTDLFKKVFNKTVNDMEKTKMYGVIDGLYRAGIIKDDVKVLGEIIRLSRNDYGHVKKVDVDVKTTEAFLRALPNYINKVYEAIDKQP